MRPESSLGRFLVHYLNNLNTSDCQNDECFLIILLQWFIIQVYSTPTIIFFPSTKQHALFFLFLVVYSPLKQFPVYPQKNVFYLRAISECAWAIIFNKISIVWLKIKYGNGLWFH